MSITGDFFDAAESAIKWKNSAFYNYHFPPSYPPLIPWLF